VNQPRAMDLRVTHTADPDAATLRAARAPPDAAFGGLAVPLDRTAALTCDWRDGDLW